LLRHRVGHGVYADEDDAPVAFDELCERCIKLGVGERPGRGWHVHISPPCQPWVCGHGYPLAPLLNMLELAVQNGATVSMECEGRKKKFAAAVSTWIQARPRERGCFKVYVIDAFKYGIPTYRQRCIVTSFPMPGETDRAGCQ